MRRDGQPRAHRPCDERHCHEGEGDRAGREPPARGDAMKQRHHQNQREQARDPAHGPQRYSRRRDFDNACERRYFQRVPSPPKNWIEAVRFGDDGLVPVVAQSAVAGEVLMVAYADREALEKTRDTGQAHYRSRSRGELWQKGATSGHTQTVQEVRVDCDGDAVLYLVRQQGPACHTGAPTCFGEATGGTLTRRARTVAERARDKPAGARALGMDSLAVTDHGNLHGAWQFYTEAKSRGLRPILGFEAYLAFGSRHKREKPVDAPAGYSHLVLLAKNRSGYSNLIKLSSIGFLEGFYRRPRIDREALEQHRDGLIGLAACLSGEIALYLRQGNYEAAKASASYFAQLFGNDGFWLEVQDHGLADE